MVNVRYAQKTLTNHVRGATVDARTERSPMGAIIIIILIIWLLLP